MGTTLKDRVLARWRWEKKLEKIGGNNMKTVWKRHPVYLYDVSSTGKVRNPETKLEKSQQDKGYLYVLLKRDLEKAKMVSVHSMVLETFVGPRPDGYQCDHIDDDKKNNNIENLEWVTPQENQRRSMINKPTGLNAEKVREIRALKLAQPKLTQREIADKYNVSDSAISDLLNPNHPAWNYVD